MNTSIISNEQSKKEEKNLALNIRQVMKLNSQLADSYQEPLKDESSWWENSISCREMKKFNPKQYIVSGKTEKDIILYKQIFDYLDVEKNGVLTPKEIRLAMEKQFPYRRDLKNIVIKIFADFDDDGSGEIGILLLHIIDSSQQNHFYADFAEFINILVKKPCEKDKESDIRQVFDYIDSNQNDYISLDDLKLLASDQNEKLSDADLQEIMLKCDPINKGEKISFQAFLNFNRHFSVNNKSLFL